MEKSDTIEINGVKQFRLELTDLLEAAQGGKRVEITTYTHGRKPRSVLVLEKVEDLGQDD